MPYDRPMLLSDLPYAHETSAGARRVAYFDPDNAEQLATLMEKTLRGGSSLFAPNEPRPTVPPTAKDWQELFTLLLS